MKTKEWEMLTKYFAGELSSNKYWNGPTATPLTV